MSRDRGKSRRSDPCAAVSEAIGTILLVSVVVVLVGIVAISLFSQTTPSKVPSLNFMTGVNSSKTTLYIYHNGGDTLNEGEFSVLLDDVPVSYTISGGGSEWSLGRNLIVPITAMPKKVDIVYGSTSTGGGVLLDQASANIVSSGTVLPDQLPYLDCSAVRNWACADQIPPEIIVAQYQKNVTTKRITFMQHGQARGTVIGGSTNHFNFTVSGSDSVIHIADPSDPGCDGGTLYPLAIGDKVGVTFISNPDYFTVYGSAPQIWEMTAGANYRVTPTLIFTNGSKRVFTGMPVCHAYISEYASLDSTLDVTTTNPGMVTALVINETHYFDGPTTTTIKQVGFQPLDSGMFLLTYGANTAPIYTVGWAQAVQFNGVNQTGLGI